MSDSENEDNNVELTEEQLEEQTAKLNQKILDVFMKYDTSHTDYMPSKDLKQAMDDMEDSVNDKMINYMMM